VIKLAGDEILSRAGELVDLFHAEGATANLVGGVAVALCSPSTGRDPFRRAYHDIDACVRYKSVPLVERVLKEQDWRPDARFNALNAGRQLRFICNADGLNLDVFIDSLRMCHTLDLRRRMNSEARTLSVADLLLGKLQIVQLNDKDKIDICALLVDHEAFSEGQNSEEIELDRIREVCRSNWGWFRTSTKTLDEVESWSDTRLSRSDATVVAERAEQVREALISAKKTFRWRVRGLMGERMKWYELPEEVGG
jgi:hypothetical protein